MPIEFFVNGMTSLETPAETLINSETFLIVNEIIENFEDRLLEKNIQIKNQLPYQVNQNLHIHFHQRGLQWQRLFLLK